MTPFFFGPAQRRLFGLFQPAEARAAAPAAVLLCNPLGQEAVRSHRMYRVLADRLQRDGFDVLRFDYFGTGDSAGADTDGDLVGWVNDVETAHAELLRRAQPSRVIWLAARLGVALALRASARVDRHPDTLVLWDAVVDGPRYLRQLTERHVHTLELAYNVPVPPWRAMLASGLLAPEREGLGFELSDRLIEQLGSLNAASLPVPRTTSSCNFVERSACAEIHDRFRQWRDARVNVNEVILEHDFDWMAPEAMDTALVPAQAVQGLRQVLIKSSK